MNAVVTPVVDPVGQPDRLQGNLYPNPASETLRLDLYQPKSGMVEIWLMNTLGQRVMKLQQSLLGRGSHNISLTGRMDHIPSGTYYLHIRSGTETLTLKLLLQ